jgi:hypothetical protein
MRNFQRRNAEKKAQLMTQRAHTYNALAPDRVITPPAPDPRQLYLLGRIARYALVIVLCACLAIPASALAHTVVPGGYAAVLPVLAICVATDLLLLAPRLNRLGVLSKEWLLLNGSRWVFIIVLVKLLSYVGRDGALNVIISELPLLRRDVFAYFFTPAFLAALLVVGCVWFAARTLGEDLAALTEGEREMIYDPEAYYRTDRNQLRQTMATHILGFGVFTALLAGGVQALWRWSTRWDTRPTSLSAMLLNLDVLVYFLIGLLLVGLTQLTMLRANWLWERTPISPNLLRRWAVYGVAFLIGLAGLALLVPTGNVSGLLPALNFLFALLFYAVQLVAILFVGLLQVLLAPLLWLMGQPAPAPPPLPPPPQQPLPRERLAETIPPPPWLDTAQDVIFFTIIAIVLGYVLRYVLQQHSGLREAIAKLPFVLWLREIKLGLQRWWLGFGAELDLLQRPNAPHAAKAPPKPNQKENAPDWRSLHLPAREQVLHLYDELLRAARAHGLPRGHSQTPREFARAFVQGLQRVAPARIADVNTLTADFEQARYAAQPVSSERVSVVQRCVWRLTSALRQVRRQ